MKPFEKKLVKAFVLAVLILSAIPYFPLIKNKLFPEKQTSPNIQPPASQQIKTIKQVRFDDCDIIITDEKGDPHNVGTLRGEPSRNDKCTGITRYIISDSGKYLMFEDVMGGVDLWLRLYSVETGIINTFDVWGTSTLFDMEFLPNDKVITLNGYKNTADEQYLSLYDIPALYAEYEINVIEPNGYLRVNKYKTALELKPVVSENGDIVKIGNKVTVFGGTVEKPILRAEFIISKL